MMILCTYIAKCLGPKGSRALVCWNRGLLCRKVEGILSRLS